MPSKPKLPKDFYYFANVHYKDGSVRQWRFTDKNKRRSAMSAFKNDKNVKKIVPSEGTG